MILNSLPDISHHYDPSYRESRCKQHPQLSLINSNASSSFSITLESAIILSVVLVSTIMECLNQCKCPVCIFAVAGNPDQDGICEARSHFRPHVQNRSTSRRFGIAFLRNNFTQEIIVQETPWSCFLSTFKQLRVLISNFHAASFNPCSSRKNKVHG